MHKNFGHCGKYFVVAAAFGFVMGGTLCGYAKHHFHGGSVNDAASVIQVASIYEALVGSSSVPGLKPMLGTWEQYQEVLQKTDSNGATDKAVDVLGSTVAYDSSTVGFGGSTVANSERNVAALLVQNISYDAEDQAAHIVNAAANLQRLADYERQTATDVLNGTGVVLESVGNALDAVYGIVSSNPQKGYAGSVQQGNAVRALGAAQQYGYVKMLYGELAHEAAVRDRERYAEQVAVAALRHNMRVGSFDPYNPTDRDNAILSARDVGTNRFAGKMFGD